VLSVVVTRYVQTLHCLNIVTFVPRRTDALSNLLCGGLLCCVLLLQVVQILEQPPARHMWAQRFLRLADDRGWVLENHPKVSFA
jgi:hypothetical protein